MRQVLTVSRPTYQNLNEIRAVSYFLRIFFSRITARSAVAFCSLCFIPFHSLISFLVRQHPVQSSPFNLHSETQGLLTSLLTVRSHHLLNCLANAGRPRRNQGRSGGNWSYSQACPRRPGITAVDVAVFPSEAKMDSLKRAGETGGAGSIVGFVMLLLKRWPVSL
jgi:hypothetical protein